MEELTGRQEEEHGRENLPIYGSWWVLVGVATAAVYTGTALFLPARHTAGMDPAIVMAVSPPAVIVGVALLFLAVATFPRLPRLHYSYAKAVAWMNIAVIAIASVLNAFRVEAIVVAGGIPGSLAWALGVLAALAASAIFLLRASRGERSNEPKRKPKTP